MGAHLLLASSCSHAEPVRLHACASDRHLGKAAPIAGRIGAVEGLEAGAIVAVARRVQQLAVVVAVGAVRSTTKAQATAIAAVGERAQVSDRGVAAIEGAVSRGGLALGAARAHAAAAAAAVIVQVRGGALVAQ